ncbi:DUF4389 domain-containing protein [bacterium SCSIO 12696]|nr:DUF4389 domain-containing protein [bacterium SCSIO 12696]
MSEKQGQPHFLNVNVWLRLLFMAFALVCLFIARILVWVAVVFQFLVVLFTGQDNDNLRNFGQGVSKWVYQCLLFLTFNSEEKPFPFNEWPEVEPGEPYRAPQPEVVSEKEPEEEQQKEQQQEPQPEPQPEPQATAPVEPTYQGGEAEVELDDQPEPLESPAEDTSSLNSAPLNSDGQDDPEKRG